MKKITFLVAWLVILKLSKCSDPEQEDEELRARDFMAILNMNMEIDNNIQTEATWDYAIDMNEENLKKKIETTIRIHKKEMELMEQFADFNWRCFSDPDLRRQFLLYSVKGINAVSPEDISRFKGIMTEMEKTHSMAKICDFKNKTKCDLHLFPDLINLHARSRDEEELKHAWISLRDAIGPHVRHLYKDYVVLLNQSAKLKGFKSADLMWLFPYDETCSNDIRLQFEHLLEQVKPLYQQLHAYVRYKLRQVYENIVSERGSIPVHLVGDVWGQSWINLAKDFKPYPKAKHRDLELALEKQNFTLEKKLHTAEEFFTSIGLPPMTDTFWKKSVLRKSPGRNMVCHPTAWDFQKEDDFRIKMCSTFSAMEFFIIHHEVGHIQYFMQYRDQPYIFRQGANPGFHEAVGDLIALSVQSPKHLASLRLLDESFDTKEDILNNLFEIALEKIISIPYSYVVDKWRWGVFSGDITPEHYNCKWWELREDLQGVVPPVQRTEDDFDPASKFHISNNVPYIRYFVSSILQFQFHRALCEKSGEYDPDDPKKPLHLCDIYGKQEAGSILKEMMAMGSSKPWPEALHVVTGQRYMDASAILEYFRPLQSWLEKENRKNGVHIGWEKSSKSCGEDDGKR